MQGSRDTPRTPSEHDHSLSGNVSDSGIGYSFFPPDVKAEAFVSTPMTSKPPLGQDYEQKQGQKQQFRRWVKFVLFWIFVVVSVLMVHFGIGQFKRLKSILTEKKWKSWSPSVCFTLL